MDIPIGRRPCGDRGRGQMVQLIDKPRTAKELPATRKKLGRSSPSSPEDTLKEHFVLCSCRSTFLLLRPPVWQPEEHTNALQKTLSLQYTILEGNQRTFTCYEKLALVRKKALFMN